MRSTTSPAHKGWVVGAIHQRLSPLDHAGITVICSDGGGVGNQLAIAGVRTLQRFSGSRRMLAPFSATVRENTATTGFDQIENNLADPDRLPGIFGISLSAADHNVRAKLLRSDADRTATL